MFNQRAEKCKVQSAKCLHFAAISVDFADVFFRFLALVLVGFVSVSVSLVAAVIFLHATRDARRRSAMVFY